MFMLWPSGWQLISNDNLETILKMYTPSPCDHISFPNMTEYDMVVFHLRANKN